MLNSWEIAKTLANLLFLDSCNVSSDTCSQRIVDVVLASKTEAFLLHIEWLRLFNLILTFLDISYYTFLFQFREGVLD